MTKFLKLLIATLVFAGTAAWAVGQHYDAATFEALQKAGKPTLVFIHADWCPTCRAEDVILKDLLQKPELAGLTTLQIDFDSQKDAVRSFKATTQSTLIVFKGGKEVGRSVGDTAAPSIEALLHKAL